MHALNRRDSLGLDVNEDVNSATNTTRVLDTYRRLTAAGYGDSPEEFRPDLAATNFGPEYFGRDFYGEDQFGGFFGSIAKGISSVGKGVVRTAGKVPGLSPMLAPVRAVSDIARGKNVLKTVRAQAEAVVADTRRSLPIAAGVVSVVPGVGTGVAAGLSAANALSQGKNLREIAEDAAIGAVPGGALVKASLRAGINVARGQNVIRAVGREGIQYAKSQLPGGQLVQQAATTAASIVLGKSPAAIARQLVTSPLVKVGPAGAALQFGRNIPANAIAATTTQVLRAASSRNPSVVANVRKIVANTQTAARAGNPGAQVAVRTLQNAVAQRLNRR